MFKIEIVPIKKLKAAKYNPRKITDRESRKLKESIKEYGLVQNIIINKDNTIIGGHQRVQACAELGILEVPCVRLNLNDDKERALNIAMNKIGGDFDNSALTELLKELNESKTPLVTGYDKDEINRLFFKQKGKEARSLIQDFIIPPFSIFDCKQPYWQQLKKEWQQQLGRVKVGRENLTGGMGNLESVMGKDMQGTSSYDPVMLQVLYTWFVPPKGLILDPFAGGPTGGAVASILGYKFIGLDTWKEQVENNTQYLSQMKEKGAVWHNTVGENMNAYVKPGTVDAIVTCPPYFNLEVYQPDDENDLSAKKTYQDFLKGYEAVMAETYRAVKSDGWCIVVIANVRDAEGNYYNLVGDTVTIMQKHGWKFYNEIILATAYATAPVRARRNFKSKKVAKVHQNILFFRKGQQVAISGAIRDILETGQSATAHHDILIFKK